jgi:hypothetical protein
LQPVCPGGADRFFARCFRTFLLGGGNASPSGGRPRARPFPQ